MEKKKKVDGEFFCTSAKCIAHVRHGEHGRYLGIDGSIFFYCPFCGGKFDLDGLSN